MLQIVYRVPYEHRYYPDITTFHELLKKKKKTQCMFLYQNLNYYLTLIKNIISKVVYTKYLVENLV